ncbi:MAG: peptide deformylase [Anaerolineae bacterium]|nr:peptide deformylase [Anaerolineae bacterium]
MAEREILLLGNPLLYRVSSAVEPEDLAEMAAVVADLRDTLLAFRGRYGAGRAIAAPQIGVRKRLVYVHLEGTTSAHLAEGPMVLLNPQFTWRSDEMMTVWDDCMCFPDLLVRVLRHRACRLEYRDLEWRPRVWDLEGDLSELLQHECDHLDGVLAVSRAVDGRSFALRSQSHLVVPEPPPAGPKPLQGQP